MGTRKRRFGSIAKELVRKAREAMLTAVQVYNNPQIDFKSELFIVTTIIAWTYFLHAYYRRKRVEYRQFKQEKKDDNSYALDLEQSDIGAWRNV